MKITVPGSIGGMKVAIAWPNMWLSGSRFRNRSGKNGLPHFRYLRTSRSTGTMFARTLRWVMTTPLGSAVAPEVKMISAMSSRVIDDVRAARPRASHRQSSSCSFHTGTPAGARERRHVLADQDQPGRDDRGDARQEIGRGAVVDRHDDDAAQQARPERDDPLRPVLAPEDNFVAFAQAERVQARRQPARRARDLGVRIAAAAEPVVVDQELAARLREIAEKVNERIAGHE